MTDEHLFELGSWAGDATRPGRHTISPAELVAGLSRRDRERRVRALVDQAHEIVDEALHTHFVAHELTASCLMWSGGNDSNVLAHLMRGRVSHAVHANTGIGIEATRQHVRDTCRQWKLPLIEKAPAEKDSYERFVLAHGFPGPGQHDRMFQRLKERTFDAVRRRFNTDPRRQRVLFLAGRRREESRRRGGNAVAGIAPLANWTKLDLNTYRAMHPDVPRNEVADLLHMSGECLCGSFAQRGELAHLRTFYPEVAAYLDDLGRRALANGVPPRRCEWGWGWNRTARSRTSGTASLSRLCGSCQRTGQFSFRQMPDRHATPSRRTPS
ncbi:phosphoadenosine phosphosulfate reductase family protein [Amycolatopsis roodepoortensis]|uniref:3'-phosphoadenosine 5'-phosphosulfate sulfotransferase (PAPS reductase)/FAD synthetase n=1 Tax=Amycolatopsis roodepoortensis TaxID=700274 RepID=A0ABR9LIJ8_9PSEU|nr:phosphoadenosine phosphosulfate reductase family protein [Amycolatopsis roodepoortensis]MBE1580494.1 3'-phosphoadenosine 5'-phosphosulfate sulfotransferase (PAPS reductase)/FAD synthetase [Amycolatopsis roodepoortensis]